jgi:hypothetical protein
MKISSAIGAAFAAIGIIFILSVVFSLPVMWLWNSTLPELFGFKEIGLWMAWKLGFLCSFLFKSFSVASSK